MTCVEYNIVRNSCNLCRLLYQLVSNILQHCTQESLPGLTLCNVASDNYDLCQLSATLRAAAVKCVNYLQHCVQQSQWVSTIYNIVRDNLWLVLTICIVARDNYDLFQLSAALREVIFICVNYLQHRVE